MTLTIHLGEFLTMLSGKPALKHVYAAEGSAPLFLVRVTAAPSVRWSSIVSNIHFSACVLARPLSLLARPIKRVHNGIPGPESVLVARGGEGRVNANVVTFHCYKEDVWAHRNATDVSIVPSNLDEPFGSSAVKVILSARPLIVSGRYGLREAAAGSLRIGHACSARSKPPQPAQVADDLNQKMYALVTSATQRRSHVQS